MNLYVRKLGAMKGINEEFWYFDSFYINRRKKVWAECRFTC